MNYLELTTIGLLSALLVSVSLLMTLFPSRVANYVRNSGMWRRYLRLTSGLRAEDISAERLHIRFQGVVGLVFSLILLVAFWKRLIS